MRFELDRLTISVPVPMNCSVIIQFCEVLRWIDLILFLNVFIISF